MSEPKISQHRELSGVAMVDTNKASAGEKLVAILIVIGCAVVGGFIFKVLSKG
jgi:hypothetical protein